MKLNNSELLEIKGGAVSATLINAIVKGIELLMNLGKMLGSTIRRATSNNPCEF